MSNQWITPVGLAFGVLCLVWGTTYLGIEIAVKEHIPPFFLSGLRHVIAGFIFITFCWAKGVAMPNLSQMLKLAGIGVLMILGGNALVCWAEQFIPSGLTAIICSLSPMFITLMSILAFKNFKINWQIIFGLCLGLGGIVCIFFKNLSAVWTEHTTMGVVLLVAANLSWGLGSIFMKKNQLQLNLFMSIGFQMLLAGALNCLIAFLFEDLSQISTISINGWYALIYLIIFGSLIGYGCYGYVLSQYLPSRVSIHTYINTIIAVFVGCLFGSDTLDFFVLLGTALVLGGVVIVNSQYAKMSRIA
jgi:drug/metabolite transporter (DMT)-like permease